MADNEGTVTNRRSIWIRALYMLLMAVILQICGTLLCALTLVQFVLVLLTAAPNARLIVFSRSLGAICSRLSGSLPSLRKRCRSLLAIGLLANESITLRLNPNA
jgi:hypothetical protein